MAIHLIVETFTRSPNATQGKFTVCNVVLSNTVYSTETVNKKNFQIKALIVYMLSTIAKKGR